MTQFRDLAAARYVDLTTFRRDGTPVGTPVWLAGDAAEIVVMTPQATGKVKRLRHTPRVLVQPCSPTGRPSPGTTPVEAVAEIVDDPAESERIVRRVLRRYPVLGTLISLAYRVRGRRSRDQVGLRIRPVDTAG